MVTIVCKDLIGVIAIPVDNPVQLMRNLALIGSQLLSGDELIFREESQLSEEQHQHE